MQKRREEGACWAQWNLINVANGRAARPFSVWLVEGTATLWSSSTSSSPEEVSPEDRLAVNESMYEYLVTTISYEFIDTGR